MIENLERIRQRLVQLADFVGHAKVDGAVTNLDNQTPKNIGVDLQKELVGGIISMVVGSMITFATVRSFFPWLYSLLAMAVSIRCSVFVSSFYSIPLVPTLSNHQGHSQQHS